MGVWGLTEGGNRIGCSDCIAMGQYFIYDTAVVLDKQGKEYEGEKGDRGVYGHDAGTKYVVSL